MEEKHTIVLSNGKSYEATLNGNNYIFDTVVPSDVFTNDTIKNMKIDGVTTNVDKVVAHFMEDGKDHVIFGNFTSTDILRQRVADLESAIALSMGGVS